MAPKKVRKSTSTSNLKTGAASDKLPPPKTHVILAIDFGSTEIRALLLDPKNPGDPWQLGAEIFDSTCAPLDPESLSIFGGEASESPNNLSSKYLLYLLSNKGKKALKVYPLSDKILDERNKNTFRKVLISLLTKFKGLIDNRLPESFKYNENIILTIPGHWDNALEADYISIIREVFGDGNKSDNIHTLPDTEALAKFVRFSQPELLNGRQKVLFLDFGAHCMSWSLFTFETVRGGDRKVVVNGTGGVAGGFETWTTPHVSKVIEAKLEKKDLNPEEFLSGMIAHFRGMKEQTLQDLHVQDDDKQYQLDVLGGLLLKRHVVLIGNELNDCFVEGMKEPIKLAREKLNELAVKEKAGSKVRVVITGGIMRGAYARNALFKSPRNEYGPLPGTNSARVTYLTEVMGGQATPPQLPNCHGAALSMVMPSSIQEFIDGGAAWAFQVTKKKEKEKEGQGRKKKNEKEYEWYWDTKVNPVSLWNVRSKNGWWVNIGECVDEGAEIKIICDPQFSKRAAARSDPPKINQTDYCYDFHTIGKLKEGMIWVRIVPVMEPGGLVFRIEYADLRTIKDSDHHGYVVCDKLRVYFDTADGRVKVEGEQPEEDPNDSHQHDGPGGPQVQGEEEEDMYTAFPRKSTRSNTAAPSQVEEEGEEDIYNASPRGSPRSNTAPSRQAADEDTDDEFHDAPEEPPQPEADEDIDQEMKDAPQEVPANNRRRSQRNQPPGNRSTPPAHLPSEPLSDSQQGRKRNVHAEPETPSHSRPTPPKRQRLRLRTGTSTSVPTQLRASTRTPQATSSSSSGPPQARPSSTGQPRGNMNPPQTRNSFSRPVAENISRPQIPETLQTSFESRLRPSRTRRSRTSQSASSRLSKENATIEDRPFASLQGGIPLRPSPSPSLNNPAPGQSTVSQGSSARPELPDETPTAISYNRKAKGFAKRGGRKG